LLKAYEYRIYPNREQEEQIAKHIGVVVGYIIMPWKRKMKAWLQIKRTYQGLIYNRLPNSRKAEDTKWLKEINSQTLQASLEHLD
jgi:transposase